MMQKQIQQQLSLVHYVKKFAIFCKNMNARDLLEISLYFSPRKILPIVRLYLYFSQLFLVNLESSAIDKKYNRTICFFDKKNSEKRKVCL